MRFKRLMHRGLVGRAALYLAVAILSLSLCHVSRADVREDAMRRIAEGVSYYERGDRRNALAAFGAAIGLDPANPLSYYNIGIINYEDGVYRDAIEDFGMAVSVSPPDFTDPMVNYGAASAALKGLEMAIISYSNAIKVDPGDSDAYYNRGLSYQRLRDLDRAMATMVVNPVDASRFDFSLVANSREAQLSKAIESFTRAIEIDPRDAGAYRNRGLAYAEGEDYGSAFRDYDRAIALDNGEPLAYFFRGTAHGRRQDFNRALIDFDRAIQINPTFVEAFIGRGAILTILDDLEGALEDFDRAITLDPRSYDAHNLRGVVHYRLGDTRDAMYDFQRAIDIDQTRPEAYENRGMAFSGIEDPVQAQEDCDEAARLAPGYAEPRMARVEACERSSSPRWTAMTYRNFIRYASPETGLQIRLSSERLKPARRDF
ncbi:MAG: tetratricopeptide repeat protein [bacterium]